MIGPNAKQLVELWKHYYLKKAAYFWIYHKFDQMGRPFDSQKVLDKIKINDTTVEVSYDQCRRIRIIGPSIINLFRDNAGTIRLEFSKFQAIQKLFVAYDIVSPKYNDVQRLKIEQSGDEVRLVGHSPNIWSPDEVNDDDYRKLFLKAQLRQEW